LGELGRFSSFRTLGALLCGAVAAIKEIGILSGVRIERSERGRPGEFDDLSTEQIVSELRELGVEVKLH
jgi:hypothetical protein